MKKLYSTLVLAILALAGGAQEILRTAGLEKPVEILVDQWGVPHIYAETEADLFFAQGYYAARDRLFQFEIWRRQATGTVAELLGPREVKRDIGARLFRFRGDMDAEMAYYHPRGKLIITSFVRGVNACIEEARRDPENLPLEFQLLGILPEPWTPEVVISRHQGLLGNIDEELDIGRAVALIGPEKVKALSWFHPRDPRLELDPQIDRELLFADILELYNAFRRPVRFQPADIIGDAANPDWNEYRDLARAEEEDYQRMMTEELATIGSNNWIVSGDRTQSGFPIMANDPHRSQAAPSLRYMAHLVGPGWNVIGGGEPEIPGISIGHNPYGAWGLTVYSTDAEDLYQYRTNPDNPDQYWYKGAWENMRIISDTIAVKGEAPVYVRHRYTRHGPVVFQTEQQHLAYAVRCGWQEVGGSPYLASLRMDQARNFEEFREACNYSHIPGENMIWADREGNIGWQAVGIAPIRRNWSGLVPVPGDGSYEWDGYLPIIAKPNVLNPPSGIFATANEDVTPQYYEYWDAIGYSWSDPYRGDRVKEVLRSGKYHTLMDMARLQTDYLSLPALELIPLLKGLPAADLEVESARQLLLSWDGQMLPESVAAAIYHAWERTLVRDMDNLVIPESVQAYLGLQMKQVVDWLTLPDGKFGEDAIGGRDTFVLAALEKAVRYLEGKLGPDRSKWQYGQENYKHIRLRHPLSNAVSPEVRDRLEVGPVARGGNSYTVNMTSSGDNQTSGASFRIIVDTGDWDRALATNNPGQSGDPDHKNYRNLFKIWAADKYFPLFFSREKIESVTETTIRLEPKQ